MEGLFALRIFSVDSYMTKPTSGLDVTTSATRKRHITRVPIIRIFGSTPAGQTVCMHVHGCFPYILVKPIGLLDNNPDEFLFELAMKIDAALNSNLSAEAVKYDHVFKIMPLKAKSFYGYSSTEEVFLKIYLYSSFDVKRTCEVLQSGSVMNYSFQTYESHVPHILQFFMDYNLHGMDLIYLKYFWVRRNEKCGDKPPCRNRTPPVSSCNHKSSSCPMQVIWSNDTIDDAAYIPSDVLQRQSLCDLEIDVLTADILNKNEMRTSSGLNPGIAALWDDERENIKKIEDFNGSLERSVRSQHEHFQEEALKNLKAVVVNQQDGSSAASPSSLRRISTDSSASLMTSQVMTQSVDQLRSRSTSLEETFCSDLHDMDIRRSFLGNEMDEEEMDPEEEEDIANETILMQNPWELGVEELISDETPSTNDTISYESDNTPSILSQAAQNLEKSFTDSSSQRNSNHLQLASISTRSNSANPTRYLEIHVTTKPPSYQQVLDDMSLSLPERPPPHGLPGNNEDVDEFSPRASSPRGLQHWRVVSASNSQLADQLLPVVQNLKKNPTLAKALLDPGKVYLLGGTRCPPCRGEVEKFLRERDELNETVTRDDSTATICCENNNNNQQQHIKIISMELHSNSRQDLASDPQIDEIAAIFYSISNMDDDDGGASAERKALIVGVKSAANCNFESEWFGSEADMIARFLQILHRHDPDLLVGHEIEMRSWGYLIARGQVLGRDMRRDVSRVPVRPSARPQHDSCYTLEGRIAVSMSGRVLLNLWKVYRHDGLHLRSFTFENVSWRILAKRRPHYSQSTLNLWFRQAGAAEGEGSRRGRLDRLLAYYMERAVANVALMEKLEVVKKTSEFSHIYGIQFEEVLSRGSQFKVESMMLRQARQRNFVAVSPSIMQRAAQRAPESVPLIFEPESRLYRGPVIVLDFQSLYPSIMIAYNYCFSTCLGRLEHLLQDDQPFPFGCTSHHVPRNELRKLLDQQALTISPNGVVFVKSKVRRGVLPKMVKEILKARIMTKKVMKNCEDGEMRRQLDHRQLGLKLIANVTFGYTAASYSGRMPCVEISDSIIETARQTLERAIEYVNCNYRRWKARVVYGDTDSMFISLDEGVSKEEAFKVGLEIVDEITKSNPDPVKLKFEKVYLPCILQTKKRYVGYSYESLEQHQPIFDAKGIETVRRDGCPAVSSTLEGMIRLLFENHPITTVRKYVDKRCSDVLHGTANFEDYIISKEYRGVNNYKPGAVVPGLVLARKRLARDKRSEPRPGQHIPYVVVCGAPGVPLFTLVHEPDELQRNPALRLNGTYYVTKLLLPALHRMMSLLKVDVYSWYRELPRIVTNSYHDVKSSATSKATISQYFESKHCLACHAISTLPLCKTCTSSSKLHQAAVVALNSRRRSLERRRMLVYKVCSNCTKSVDSILCESIDCPLLFQRVRSEQNKLLVEKLEQVLEDCSNPT